MRFEANLIGRDPEHQRELLWFGAAIGNGGHWFLAFWQPAFVLTDF
ncbi:MAG TPA: hypothetical protein PLU80_03175 [Acidobacteriota bacterium]|nr:hypothetical protein [Acidobacteriota bacterium]